jgi:ubiquinone/menaquinone biosynthesis C-methylase UbiE
MTHEARVERFYARGVENFGTFHGGYLNFGLWSSGAESYVQAAEALVARLGAEIGLSRESVVLDVACGMGAEAPFLMRRFGCRAIEAVDLTAKHVEIARARNTHPGVTYRVANACALPFSTATFTHALAIEGIVHFDTREAFFREAHRVLRSGGRLGVSDFILARKPRTRAERALLSATVSAWRVPPANVMTATEYVEALERSGFVDPELAIVSDQVIPGYVSEQSRPEVRRQQRAIRGQLIGRLGTVIDLLVYRLYRMGLLGYVLARARKGPA